MRELTLSSFLHHEFRCTLAIEILTELCKHEHCSQQEDKGPALGQPTIWTGVGRSWGDIQEVN